jgi:hypothetical protein
MLAPYDHLDPSSRVWIYQAAQLLTETQVEAIRAELTNFLDQWTAHNRQLYTWGDVMYRRFVVIMADERYAGASGCSIDKSVHFIEHLEKKHHLSLLSRTGVAYLTHEGPAGDDIKTCELDDLRRLAGEGVINNDTLVFDNLVKTKEDFDTRWRKPLAESWHRKFV